VVIGSGGVGVDDGGVIEEGIENGYWIIWVIDLSSKWDQFFWEENRGIRLWVLVLRKWRTWWYGDSGRSIFLEKKGEEKMIADICCF